MGDVVGGRSCDLEWVEEHQSGLVKPDGPDAKDVSVGRPAAADAAAEQNGDDADVASMGNVSLNISELPKVTVPVDCVPTEKCTLGKGSCAKVRDHFLFIQSGIQDVDQVADHGAVAVTGLVKPDDPDAKIQFLAAEALRGVPRQR